MKLLLDGGDNAVQLLGGTASLKFGRAKTFKNDAIYDYFWVWPQISLEWIKISTIGKKELSGTINPALNKENLVKFGPLTPEITRLMFIYPKSTVCILHTVMHLSAGHMTLLPGELHPPKFSPQLDLGRRADSRWFLP